MPALAAGASIGAKRNLAISRARGDVILHFDDDDVYAPAYARLLARPLAAKAARIAKLSAWFVLDAKTGRVGYVDTDDAGKLAAAPQNVKYFLDRARTSYGFTLAYTKRLALDCPFDDDLSLGEDAKFLIDAADRGAAPAYLRDAAGVVLHVQHGENATKSVCLDSVNADFLRRSPLKTVLPAFREPIDDEGGGLFLYDVELAAARSKDDFLARLLTFINTDEGHAADRSHKLGI